MYINVISPKTRRIKHAITEFLDEKVAENSLLSAPIPPFMNESQSAPRKDYGLDTLDYSFSKAITLD